MSVTELTTVGSGARARAMKRAFILIAASGTVGCINVKAPDKPIEINLNVNIKQEVIVRLQKDAQTLITDNPELFPK